MLAPHSLTAKIKRPHYTKREGLPPGGRFVFCCLAGLLFLLDTGLAGWGTLAGPLGTRFH